MRFAAITVAAAAVAAVMPFAGVSVYAGTLVYYAAYYLVLGQAWNMMSGLTGYVSFTHGALAGIGAYTAVIAINGGWPIALALVGAVAVTAFASLVIGATSLRLRGTAFTFATLFFQELLLLAVRKLPAAGGAAGTTLQEILPTSLPHVLMVSTAAAATIAFALLRRSRTGVRLLAIKGDEDAAAAVGIDATRLKIAVFCASAALCGLAGGIHALFVASLHPESVFSVDTSIVALAVPLIGGVETALGPVVGAILYVGLREILQIVAPSLHLVVVGLLILLVTLFLRDGIVGAARRLLQRRRSYRAALETAR